MTSTRTSIDHLLPLILLLVTGTGLWYLHAVAWDLGGRSPILSYDSAQYALAARELAWHGKLATPYALPVDLAWHRDSPWSLSVVQPGLVLIEALLFKIVPWFGGKIGSDPRAWLTLIPVFTSYLMLGAGAMLGMRRLLARHVPEASRAVMIGAPLTIGL